MSKSSTPRFQGNPPPCGHLEDGETAVNPGKIAGLCSHGEMATAFCHRSALGDDILTGEFLTRADSFVASAETLFSRLKNLCPSKGSVDSIVFLNLVSLIVILSFCAIRDSQVSNTFLSVYHRDAETLLEDRQRVAVDDDGC